MKQAVLAWQLADYLAAGDEPPERIVLHPEACEGELMSDDEIEEYLADSLGTMLILRDKGSPAAERVQAIYLADLEFLASLGRISPDDYNDLSSQANLRL